MATPDSSGRSELSSVHATAADALAALIEQGEAWPPASLQRFRNVLLDACGSDHRPLIELLMRVGRHGIVDALRALGTVSSSDWPTRRTTLVSRACGELFIGAEIAAWAVDAWAVALGVVPRASARALQQQYAVSATNARQRAESMLPHTARATRVTGSITRPGAPPAMSGLTNSRVGAWKRGAAAAIMAAPRWRVPAASIPAPDLTLYYRLLAVAGVLMLAAVLWQRLSAREAPVPSASNPLAASVASPASDTGAASVASPASDTGAASVASPDGLIAQDTSITVAEVITVTEPTPQQASTPPQAIAVSPPPLVAEMAGTLDENIRRAGVGGSYRVQQRILSVRGSALCDPLADALSRRVLQSEEQVAHAPDSAHFALASRPGVQGMVHTDGVFFTSPYRGTHDGVRFDFRMSGRFTTNGFIARTVTQTEAVIKYRQQQRCVVVADLIGSRTSATGAPE